MANEKSVGGGIGFFSLLGLIFITLKLCGVINWSWLWVLAPLWGPIALSFVVLVLYAALALFVFAIATIVYLVMDLQSKKKRK